MKRRRLCHRCHTKPIAKNRRKYCSQRCTGASWNDRNPDGHRKAALDYYHRTKGKR